MANTHSVPINQYSSDDGELFRVKLKDGSTLELVDINGLSYLGDMILGKTNELKQFGLDVADVDGEGTFTGDIDPEAPSAAIRYPTSGYKWPNGVIPYHIEHSLTQRAKEDFLYAVNHWNSKTQVQLIPRTNEQDYISVVNGGGCSSWIGRSGGRQSLTLASNCGRGAAVHEIGHAVGFFHEQTRTDRDSYIDILWQNIQANMSYNFQKITRGQGLDHRGYDYYSIMHYRTSAFGIGNRTTIHIKDSAVNSRLVGNGTVLSDGDLSAIAYMYGDNEPDQCQVRSLQNDQPLLLNGAANSNHCFKVQLPNNSTSYRVTTQADNGDADLFVRHNGAASSTNYDCKSDGEHSNESCVGNAQSGVLNVNVFAYKAFSNLQLSAHIEVAETPCTIFELMTTQQTSVTALAKRSMCFKLAVPEGVNQVEFNTWGGRGDADLYVQKSSLPTLEKFACKSAKQTSVERCLVSTKGGGDYYVRVYAWDDISEVSLSATFTSNPEPATRYTGELSTTDEVDIQPNNQWFEYQGGQLKASLSSTNSTADLELVLQRWNGRDRVWYDLQGSTTPDSNESITRDVNAGYYRYKVYSWNAKSKSKYTFTLAK
ncbi:MAG: hypothetical protein GY919_07945 [Photobacterium aquimaris]|nr:hypothetical protein [Photobacterium aquimaris]